MYSETHFRARQQAVTELFFNHCLAAGVRHVDVKDAALGRVAKELGGPIRVDGTPLSIGPGDEVLLVTPRDRSGWCVAYPGRRDLGARLVDLAGQPCPLEENERSWERHLGIDAAIHGYVNPETHEWGWVVRRERTASQRSSAEGLEPPPGKDINGAFASVGRLFGQVNLDVVLHRLLNVARPPDLDAHKLLWTVRRPTSV